MSRNKICKEAKEKIDLHVAWFAFRKHLVIHLFIYLFICELPVVHVVFLSFHSQWNEFYWGKLKSQVLAFRPFLEIDMLLNLK